MNFKYFLFHFLLFNYFLIVHVFARGRRINIYGAENGNGDIVQLRNSRKINDSKPYSRPIYGRQILRNALLTNSPLKWSKMRDADGNYEIPFVINGEYDQTELATIYGAMSTIAKNTCIRFVRRTFQRDYAEIQNRRGEGCYASIGRFPGKNIVMLESNDDQTCIHEDTVIHELFHVIGLWHEHMRADRDHYIKVLYNNIDPSQYPQFEKLSPKDATTYNVPYDYESVMHYDESAFARRGLISMQTVDPKFQKIIGHPRTASHNDYKKVCAIYWCTKCMGQDFKTIIETSNIDLKIPERSLPVKECKDTLSICAVLNSKSLLNCNVMSTYCCESCTTIPPTTTPSTQTIAPVYTPSGIWSRITSLFS